MAAPKKPTSQRLSFLKAIAADQQECRLRLGQFQKISMRDAYRKLSAAPQDKSEHLQDFLEEWISGLGVELHRYAAAYFKVAIRSQDLSTPEALLAIDETLGKALFCAAFHFPDIDFENSSDDRVVKNEYSINSEPIERYEEPVRAWIRYACDGWRQLETGREKAVPDPSVMTVFSIPVWTAPPWLFPELSISATCFELERAFELFVTEWARKLKSAVFHAVNDAAASTLSPKPAKGGRPRTTAKHQSIKHIAYLKGRRNLTPDDVRKILFLGKIELPERLSNYGCSSWIDKAPERSEQIRKMIDRYKGKKLSAKELSEMETFYSNLASPSRSTMRVPTTSPKL